MSLPKEVAKQLAAEMAAERDAHLARVAELEKSLALLEVGTSLAMEVDQNVELNESSPTDTEDPASWRLPSEIIGRIVFYVHQETHAQAYENALFGLHHPSPSPDQLADLLTQQLLSKDWKRYAEECRYKQLDLDIANLDSLTTLARTMDESHPNRPHPASKARLIVVHGKPHNEAVWQVGTGAIEFIMQDCGNWNHHEAVLPAGRFGLERCPLTQRTTFVFLSAPDHTRMREWASTLAGHWAVSRRGPTLSEWPGEVPKNACVVMRLAKAEGVVIALRHLLQVFDLLDLIPSFEIDLPFTIVPHPLDDIFPVVEQLLRHPSLPAGRNFILNKTGRAKEIVFGVHDREDAMALQLMVTALGPLQVEVRIEVLDM